MLYFVPPTELEAQLQHVGLVEGVIDFVRCGRGREITHLTSRVLGRVETGKGGAA